MFKDLELSEAARKFRAREGVGREVIAARAQVAVNTVRNVELGDTDITVSNLRRILRAYGYELRIIRTPRPKDASRLKAGEAA